MRKKREKEETPKERFIVLKFASLFALPIAATGINTHLSSDNLENCQTLRGKCTGAPESVHVDAGLLFVCGEVWRGASV